MKQQSTELKKSKKKVSNLESKLKQAKLALAAIEQLKLDLLLKRLEMLATQLLHKPKMRLLLLGHRGTRLFKT